MEVSAISLSHWEVSFISVLHPLSWDALFGAFYRTDAWYLTRTGKTYREQSIAVGAEQEIQSDHYISVLFFTFTVLFFLNYKTVKHYYHYYLSKDILISSRKGFWEPYQKVQIQFLKQSRFSDITFITSVLWNYI